MNKPTIKSTDWNNPKNSREYRIKHNKKGIWKYNPETHCIESKKTIKGHEFSYEVDLSRCKNSAELLDWIFQIESKSWASSKDLGDLCRCLDTILNVQSHYCSGGKDLKFDVDEYLKTKVDILL